MTDQATENLQRYREREARGVGGLSPYGRDHMHQRTIQQEGVVFLKDATILDPLDPSNPQHIPAWTNVKAIEVIIDGTSTTVQRIVASFERPLGTVGVGALRGLLGGAYTPVAASTPDAAPNQQAQMVVKLIQTPLIDGLSIENITHDDLGSLTTETMLITVPTDSTGGWNGSDLIIFGSMDISAGFEPYLRSGIVRNLGPYFGILIETLGSTSFQQNGDNLTTTFTLQDSKPSVNNLLRSFFIPPILMGL